MRLATAVLAVASAPAWAHPTLGGPMSHLLVTVFNQQVYLGFESPDMATVTMQSPDEFTGSAAVLSGMGYNAQFGWLANGFVSIPGNAGVFVRTVSTSPFLSVYSESGFQPILGLGDVWQWNGTMVHNWYATEVQGEHRARYEVFVGDLTGTPLTGWGSAEIELTFLYGRIKGTLPTLPATDAGSPTGTTRPVPGPAGLGLGVAGLIMARRRR